MHCPRLGGFIFVVLLACGLVGRNGHTLAALSPNFEAAMAAFGPVHRLTPAF